MIKRCNKCEKELEENMFDKDCTKKDGYSTICKSCKKQYRIDNLEIRAEKRHKRTNENREMFNERQRICRSKNRELYNNLHRNWLKNNPSKRREYHITDYLKNSDDYKRRVKLRRKLVASILSDLTNEQYEQTLKYFNYECAYCGSKENLQEEHIIPVSKHGEYTKNNIIPACSKCNMSKSAKHLNDWYPKKSFFSQERFDKITSFVNECANQSGRLDVTI